MADYFEEMGFGGMDDFDESNPLMYYAQLLRDFGVYSLLSEDKQLPPPISKHFFLNLKRETVEVKEIICPICLGEPDIGDIVIVLPCKHKFHTECIGPWFKRTSTCPLCRLEMPTDDRFYEIYRKEKIRQRRREEELQQLHNLMFT